MPVLAGEPTPEELARLNIQLEARITELQRGSMTLPPTPRPAQSALALSRLLRDESDAQLRTLLGLKLSEVYADFGALETEDRDLVVPQHYRTLVSEIFAVLKAEGVPLQEQPKEQM
jgi:hypothetical protein